MLRLALVLVLGVVPLVAASAAGPPEDAPALSTWQVEPGLDLLGLAALPAVPLPKAVGAITDVATFLDGCPTNDPIYAQLRADFELRRNGAVVGAVSCSEPVSALPTAQYTDEIIVLQGLRTIYYMDLGSAGHLPWTPGTLYQWMRSKIDGIDIRDGVAGGACCTTYDGKLFFIAGAQTDFNRDFDKTWMGISGNIAFYAHEVRHVDGFPHVSCCGITGGCDQAYDEANLSAYGVQHFLNRLWLEGDINVGFSCLPAPEFEETVNWHLGSLSVFRDRFCTNPPAVATRPAQPGGACRSSACLPGPQTLCLNGGRFAVAATWRTSQGASGAAQVVPLTTDTGYLWFFSASNVEVVIKVLNACGFNDRFWVFLAGLTDVRVDVEVTDTVSGEVKTYVNPLGLAFAPIQDTSAFATCP
jgi:hypothetical protein